MPNFAAKALARDWVEVLEIARGHEWESQRELADALGMNSANFSGYFGGKPSNSIPVRTGPKMVNKAIVSGGSFKLGAAYSNNNKAGTGPKTTYGDRFLKEAELEELIGIRNRAVASGSENYKAQEAGRDYEALVGWLVGKKPAWIDPLDWKNYAATDVSAAAKKECNGPPET